MLEKTLLCNNFAGCGGLLRNSNGQWLGGFSRHLGTCTAYIAELWGVLDGLKFAYVRGFKKIELHIDSNVVVHRAREMEVLLVGDLFTKFVVYLQWIGKSRYVILIVRQMFLPMPLLIWVVIMIRGCICMINVLLE
jgi:hypothetical protein